MLLSTFIHELEELLGNLGDMPVKLEGDKKSWNFEVGGYFEKDEHLVVGLVVANKVVGKTNSSLPFWDSEAEKEVWRTVTLKELVENPNLVNLKYFGFHILNVMRINKGLKPLMHRLDKK